MVSAGNWIALGAVIVAGLSATIGGFYGYRQLKQLAQSSQNAARAAQMEALVHVTDLVNFQTPTISKARAWVLDNEAKLLSTPLKELDGCERDRIEEVWRTWDRIGLLVHHGLVDAEPVMEMWAHSIERTYLILWGRLYERRHGGGNPHAMTHFQLLCGRAHYYNELHENKPKVEKDGIISEEDAGSPLERPGWIRA